MTRELKSFDVFHTGRYIGMPYPLQYTFLIRPFQLIFSWCKVYFNFKRETSKLKFFFFVYLPGWLSIVKKKFVVLMLERKNGSARQISF